MKKAFTLAAILVITISSCRKESHPYIYYNETTKLAYDSYAGQFDLIWKNLSTGYVFWDIDDTPWDKVYEDFLPQFEALDRQVAQGGTIPDTTLLNLYEAAMGNMSDHHMTIKIKNLHPAEGNSGIIAMTPGMIAIKKRPDYIESKADAKKHMIEFLTGIEKDYGAGSEVKVIEHQQITYDLNTDGDGLDIVAGLTYSYNLFQLPDGRVIPYLWQSNAALTPAMTYLGKDGDEGAAAAILEQYFKIIATTPKEKLAGFILDNRANRGGYQDDLDYLIGSFLNDEVVMFQTRYKEGPGRLEYSVWTDYTQKPFYKYHRDLQADNIPFVTLVDCMSASMGEIESLCARYVLPTSYVIGETSYGATGPLQANLTNLNYGGSFGSSDLSTEYHYVYTSDFEASFDGQIYEGKGITPDLKVSRKSNGGSFKPAIDAALQYISQYKGQQ